MSLLPISPRRSTLDLENAKFGLDGSGDVAVRVGGTVSMTGLLAGVVYDAVTAAYPDSVTEVYSFKTGGISGTLTATVTVIYTDSTKALIQSVEKT
jgi:hypothetical protein